MPGKLLIIGGGINGAGIARDAALRGMDVTLFEQNDFCSGTSWASSRLIHGGLRYLEHFELRLVRESLKEREILLRNYPQNVRPLRFLIPVYKHSEHHLTTIRTGMAIYDRLAFDTSLPHHTSWTAEDITAQVPGLERHELQGGITYFDGQCPFPERLVLANLHSAVEAGAKVFNYHRVEKILKNENAVAGLSVKNLMTGETKTWQADFVVNAAGPWVDGLLQSKRKLIGGTKGSHIVVKTFSSAPRLAVYANAQSDGRPFFILPWRDYYLIGTTDIRYTGALDELKPLPDEIDYLLSETNHLFPAAALTRANILFSFSGVRPLPYSQSAKAGAITRKHLVIDHEKRSRISNLISLVGGKLTPYRHAAEQVVDLIAKKTGWPLDPCRTDTTPLWGGAIGNIEDYIAQQLKAAGPASKVAERTLRHLVNFYGTEYKNILVLADEEPSLADFLSPHAEDIQAQVIYAVRYEWARTVSDVLMRRTSAGSREGLGLDCADRAAKLMGKELGWSDEKEKEEIANHTTFVKKYLMAHLEKEEN